jgi:hypothetical protein
MEEEVGNEGGGGKKMFCGRSLMKEETAMNGGSSVGEEKEGGRGL